MLVLGRSLGDHSVVIRTSDGDIVVKVLRIDKKNVKLGFTAPPSVSIDRQEIRIDKDKRA